MLCVTPRRVASSLFSETRMFCEVSSMSECTQVSSGSEFRKSFRESAAVFIAFKSLPAKRTSTGLLTGW